MALDLLHAVQEYRKQGHSDEVIKKALLDAGHAEFDVNLALSVATKAKQKKQFKFAGTHWPVILVVAIFMIGLVLFGVLSDSASEEGLENSSEEPTSVDDCDDGNACTVDTFNAITNSCEYTELPDCQEG